MKVKNIAFSGFAAAILMGVCGAANAATYQLASKDYVDTETAKKQNALTAGTGVTIVNDTVSVNTNVIATKDDIANMATTSDVTSAISEELGENGSITSAINTAVSAVESTANTASQNAEEAVQTANTASDDATSALTKAEAASSAAGTAQSTADEAKATAEEAVTTANDASTTAGQAKTAADEAKTAATNAQAAVASKQDALTAGTYISITKDESTGETVIDSTYRYDDEEIKADIQTNASNIALKASQEDLESLQETVQGKADNSTVTTLAGRVSANETALSGKESVSNKLTGETVTADDLTADKYMSALTVSKYVQGELEGALDAEGAVTDAVNTAIDNAVQNGAVNTAIQNAVADKADTSDVDALDERVIAVEEDVETLQSDSLSKAGMANGSFLVTNNDGVITYTAIEVVAGDGVTNALTDQPLTTVVTE